MTILTVPTGLYGSLDIPNTLHGDAILIVAVDILIFKLAYLVEQDS
jgi:hypothetical protein